MLKNKLLLDKERIRNERIDRVRRYIAALPCKIDKAYLFGSVARGDFVEESDTDLLVVSSDLPEDIQARMSVLALARTVAPEVEAVGWTLPEWERRKKTNDHFLTLILTEGEELTELVDILPKK